MNTSSSSQSDPVAALRAAIEKLNTFTQHNVQQNVLSASHIHNLELREGKLVAVPTTPLQKVFDLTCRFIGAVFSRQMQLSQLQQRDQIQKEISDAVDIVKSHYELIHQLQKGNTEQQELAEYTLNVIQQYNQMVAQETPDSWVSRFTRYIYERSELLVDQEIQGRKIEPRRAAIAQTTLKELGAALSSSASKQSELFHHSIHKKSLQVMLDTFRMKAMRALQSQLPQDFSMQEALKAMQQATVDIDDNPNSELIWINQILEISPGSIIRIIGSFKRHSEGKLMSIPILESFRVITYAHQAGFPYPSQHVSWGLAETLIDAYPLREGQTPLFASLEQQQQKCAQLLASDTALKNHARLLLHLKKEVFDRERSLFLNLHHQLVTAIITASPTEIEESTHEMLNQFYAHIMEADSPFEKLSQIDQYIAHWFITHPTQKLKEEWLSGNPGLRTGAPSDRLQVAIALLTSDFDRALIHINKDAAASPYISFMGELLGHASRQITLQYMSEKVGFAPPMLTDFEQKVQAGAFHQALRFFDELDTVLDELHEVNCKFMHDWLTRLFEEDLHIFMSPNFAALEPEYTDIINELEVYFNSRYYALPRPLPKPNL